MDNLGRYEILDELGRGAMGTVYRARDPKIDRLVAIKTIRAFGARPGEDEEYRKRFFREAQAAGKLSHPGIVTIYDVGEEELTKTPYIVMEYIAGRTLENLLTADERTRPSVEFSLDLLRQLAQALDYAHSQNIVHRDIKPANILVTPQGRSKITDFGVARLTHSDFTVQGQLVGTPSYMSPEQLKGDAMDGRSDLFSLSVILYWLLTGERPFTGEATSVIAQILYANPAPVSQINSSLGAEYDRVMARALAKEPAARYQRGNEIAEALAQLPLPVRGNPLQGGSFADERARVSAGSTILEKTALFSADDNSYFLASQQNSHLSGGGVRRSLTRVALAVVVISAVFFFSARFVRTMSKPTSRAAKLSVAANNPPPARVSANPLHKSSPDTAAHELPAAVTRKSSDAPARKPSSAIARKPWDATLQILCWHDFDSADLSIWVGNSLVYETKLTLTRNRISGYLATTVHVPVGERTVRVQVKSNRGNYAQTRTISADLFKGVERTLEITCNELNHGLRLAWQN